MIKIKRNHNSKNFRIIKFGILVTLGFILVVAHLAIIQFAQGKKWSEKAYSQQVKNQIISPNRGTIYDSNGEVLAQSISVDTISLNPGKVVYANGKEVKDEVIAEGISNIFDITYEEMIEKLESGKSVIIIQKKVETDKVEELKSWLAEEGITAGFNIDEDSKRYYPNEKLASNLIGFCGTDNSGQTGLEERWNDVLTGTAGKIITSVDVNKQAISDEYEQFVPSEDGSNIYLTIDTKIQAIAEKYLEQAMFENSTADTGNVIVMNPQTGDILAMASYPNYNLNSPSSYKATKYSEEEWNKLETAEKTNALLDIWKNRNVSGTYEPGSTFKLLVAAIGLEEGIVETDKAGDFFCNGIYHVDDRDIACWRSYNPHGYQSLREALQNSCNPAFMQLGLRIGAQTLYKYFDAFGLFDKVGNNISKAYKGQFCDIEHIGRVELATTSFGQRFEISPLQLVSAVSAICNDGVLVKPKIVKQVENTDTGSIEVVETEKIRQVISSETADKVKNMMLSVVTDGTGRNAQVSGYSIGGKSGTSEPQENKKEEGYVASFVAISPIENTQVITLVTVNGLAEGVNHQGGQVAGPVAAQIMSEVLPYLNIASTNSENNVTEEEILYVPDVKDMTLNDAISTLQRLGYKVISNSKADDNTLLVTEQMPKSGTPLDEGSIVCIYTVENTEKTKVKVPNVKGKSVTEARKILKNNNLNINLEGTTGIVVSQDPTYETYLEQGSIVNVTIKKELTDAQ